MSEGLHDMSDAAYWRSLSPREVVGLVREQLTESYRDVDYDNPPEPMEVIRNSLRVVGEDTQDRAVDQLHCAKADSCAGAAAFLNWLAWHLDDGFLARFEAEADR